MSPKRLRVKRVPKIRRVPKARSLNVTRAEFDAVIKLLNERGDIINELRQELHSTCRDLASQLERNRRAFEIQFTRISQLQQEIDQLKKAH